MSTRAKKAKPIQVANDFEPDAFMIRTTAADGSAYGGFMWPREVGAIVTCPDWNPEPRCGGGLHGVLDGLGNWGLMSDASDALWWVVGVVRSECVLIDGEKVKTPRAKVSYVGWQADAMTLISRHMQKAIWVQANATEAAAATTGDISAAVTTGYRSAAATTGNDSAAVTTSSRSAAATTGKNSIAAALGSDSTASAGPGGAITLAAYDDDWNLVAVFASMVGQNGVEPNVRYRLTVAGQIEAAA